MKKEDWAWLIGLIAVTVLVITVGVMGSKATDSDNTEPATGKPGCLLVNSEDNRLFGEDRAYRGIYCPV